MAPRGYLNTYRTYKAGTDRLTTWLAQAARLCGLDVEVSSGNRVPMKEFINLANAVVASKTPEINIPKEILTLAENVIALRKQAGRVFARLTGTPLETAAQSSHRHFISVLEQVLDILRTVSKDVAGTVSTSAGAGEADIVDEPSMTNMFAALNVEEPSAAMQTPGSAKPTKPKHAPTYELEISEEDAKLMTTLTSLKDINDIRACVRKLWLDYRNGKLGLMSAAVTTDTAYGVVKRICEDLSNVIPGDQKYWTMTQQFTENEWLHQGDNYGEMSLEMADWLAMPTESILDNFTDVLEPRSVPVYKPGHFGKYDPNKWASGARYQDLHHNDRILLLEYLPEVTKISRVNMHLPVQDELTAGLRVMMDTCNIFKCPMHAIFATHIFLDIHHVLGDSAADPFHELQGSAKESIAILDGYFKFTGNQRISTWPAQNDQVFRNVKELAQEWALTDKIGSVRVNVGQNVKSPPFHFLQNNPVFSGLLLFRLNLLMQDAGQTLCAAWGTVMYPIHLYNACRQSGGLETEWEDAEYLYQIHTASRILVGTPPTEPPDYLKRFILALGASASNFARNRRIGSNRPLVESKKGPRGLKTTSPIKDTFMGYYNDKDLASPVLSIQNIIAMLAVASKAQRTLPPAIDIDTVARGVATQPQITPLQMLICVREGLAAEELHLVFDYIGLHRRGLTMLRELRSRLHDDLVKYVGSGYLEDESQLPYVVGYIFEIVSGSHAAAEKLKVGAHGSRILHEASEVLKQFLQKDENSGKGLMEARARTRAVRYAYLTDQLERLQIWDPQRAAKAEKKRREMEQEP